MTPSKQDIEFADRQAPGRRVLLIGSLAAIATAAVGGAPSASAAQGLTIATSTMGSPTVDVDVAVNRYILVTGATTWKITVTSGALPPGWAVTGDRYITGSTKVPGDYTFGLTATSGKLTSAEKQIKVSVQGKEPAPVFKTSSLADGADLQVGQELNRVINVVASGQVVLSVESGVLPEGAAISGQSIVGRIGSKTGSYKFALGASANGKKTVATFSGKVVAQPVAAGAPVFVTGTIGEGLKVGSSVRKYILATNTDGSSATVTLLSGVLPAGLKCTNGWVEGIVATSVVPGVFPLVFLATSPTGATSQKAMTVEIGGAAPAPAPTAPTAEPTTTPTEPTPKPSSSPATPTTGSLKRIASRGGNGTHWPSRTAYPWERSGQKIIEVDATWKAIAAGITAAAAYPNAMVLVRPGTLPGYGSGSRDRAVLGGVGQKNRKMKILVAPRDGIYTVKFSGDVRIDKVDGVSFVGFSPQDKSQTGGEGYGVLLTDITDFSWAWSQTNSVNLTAHGRVADVELVECVAPHQRIREGADRHRFATGPAGSFDGVLEDGDYWAPSSVEAGSKYHNDSLQLEGESAKYADITVRDTALFHHVDQVTMINKGTPNWDNVAVFGGGSSERRYAVPKGIKANTQDGAPWSINGSSRMPVKNSFIVGPVKSSVKGGGAYNAGGSTFISDGRLVTQRALDAQTIPYPDVAYLQKVWNKW